MPISAVIPNLPAGTSVDVRVRAFNLAGFGPYSLTRTLSTTSPAPTPTPTGVIRNFAMPAEWRATNVPPQAAANGMTQQVFGPNLSLGSNWFKLASDVNAVQNGDGSITTTGGNNGFGMQLLTALRVGTSTAWTGTAWSGGAYFEWTMSFTGPANPTDISNGWPSLWLVDMEGSFDDRVAGHWQNQASNFYRWTTINVAEWADNHVPMPAANTIFHQFSDFFGVVGSSTEVGTGYHANGSPFVTPPGFSFSQPHKYGFLWVPATGNTPSTRGFAQYFIDDQRIDTGVAAWNLYDPALAPPPVAGTTAWSFVDARHLAAIFGTGPQNPLTVRAFSVWQRPASPTPSGETTSGTRMPPAAQFVDLQGHVWTLTGGQEIFDGLPVADTSGVTDMLYFNHAVYQHTSGDFWWGPSSSSTGGPFLPNGDPSVSPSPTPTPTPGGAPAPAAAAGFNVRTFGPDISISGVGQNWWSVAGMNTKNGDGSVTIAGSPGFGDNIQTMITSGSSFIGSAFGGGGYFEATFRYSGPAPGPVPCPAFWANDVENQLQQTTGGGQSQWLNQPTGYVNSIELDVVEVNNGYGSMGIQVHNWYGFQSSIIDFAATAAQIGQPTGLGDQTVNYHRYGCLWIPATSSSRGSLKWYFDRVQVGQTISWNQYNPGNGPPPVFNTTAWSRIDATHLYFILGTGPSNPMQCQGMEVWQASAANNIVH